LNNDVGDVYDHDKDLDLSHTNTISERRNIETSGDDKYENNQQGDELCIWLDNEISEVRGTVIYIYSCVYIYMYIYIYTHIYICLDIYTCINMHISRL
jgi:hypothetical protein